MPQAAEAQVLLMEQGLLVAQVPLVVQVLSALQGLLVEVVRGTDVQDFREREVVL